jgi:phytanoyl-CoA hydroxylase
MPGTLTDSMFDTQTDARALGEDCDRNGFCVARQVFSAEEIAQIRDTFMAANVDGPVEGLSEIRHIGAGRVAGYDPNDPLSFYPRMMHPHRHPEMAVGPLAKKYMLDRRLHAILSAIFHEEPAAVQSMFYFKPPGARGQDLHQDNFYLRVKPGTCCAAWIAIDDADEENGGMRVVPGTHDMEVVCPEKADPTLYFTTEHVEPPPGKTAEIVRLKAGDVMFFNGSVVHGSYPNTSKTRFRRSLICHYVPASTRELSPGYVDPTLFDGTLIKIDAAEGGGPCGTPFAAASPH